MKVIYVIIFTLLYSTTNFAQDYEDSKMIITVDDTINFYNRVKKALVNKDFVVKENMNPDTLSTYTRQLKTRQGYAVLYAAINEYTVTLYGFYSLEAGDRYGEGRLPKNYKRILYFKGSKL